jgi:hypothetical protein
MVPQRPSHGQRDAKYSDLWGLAFSDWEKMTLLAEPEKICLAGLHIQSCRGGTA